LKLSVSQVEMITTKALDLGFSACGFIALRSFEKEKNRFLKWLSDKNNGDMAFLEQNIEKRFNPKLLGDGFRSAIVVLMTYNQKTPENKTTRISKYALGKDYHLVMKEKLFELEQYISVKITPMKARCFVDSAPVYESQLAVDAGLGWKGKNTLVINQEFGSFLFIGELLSNMEFPDNNKRIVANHCGTCTRCIDACPTQALKPFQLDAKKCISYLTIERKSLSAPEFDTTPWIYGCDICQDVCPWNQNRPTTKEKEFMPNAFLLSATINDWEILTEDDFKTFFKDSPILRTGYKRMMRNIRQ